MKVGEPSFPPPSSPRDLPARRVPPGFRLPVVLLLDLAVPAATALASGRPQDPVGLTFILAALLVFHHGDVTRWRAPSLLLSGWLLAALLPWAGSLAVDAAFSASPWARHPWFFFLAPLPGHAAASVYTYIQSKIPVAFRSPGRARRLALRAIARTPLCPFRQAAAGESPAARLDLPSAAFGDRDIHLALADGPLPLFPEGPESGMGLAVRRTLDIILGSLLLLLVAPLIGLLAVAVKLTSPGPAFYSQVRVTRGGRTFRIHKLRSMVREAEPGGRPVWPEEDDPRITPLGRHLRRFWIDELPQLLDVIRGPMTLVGPRPERPAFVKEFAQSLPNYRLRHQVRSGMTGLSQVLGFTGNTPLSRRLHLDLRYITIWTPWVDGKILLATILQILARLAHRRKEPDVPRRQERHHLQEERPAGAGPGDA